MIISIKKKISRSNDSFRKIYIFDNGGHICWKAGLSDTVLKEDNSRTLLAKFGNNWYREFRGECPKKIFYFLLQQPYLKVGGPTKDPTSQVLLKVAN